MSRKCCLDFAVTLTVCRKCLVCEQFVETGNNVRGMRRFNKDKKMAAKFALLALLAVAALLSGVHANPAIAMGYDPLELCIENCAQCKKMLGAWFEGPLCAESCIKYKGKLIPECEDFASISPFLNKL